MDPEALPRPPHPTTPLSRSADTGSANTVRIGAVSSSPATDAAPRHGEPSRPAPSPELPRASHLHAATLANGLTVWVQRHPYPPRHVALGLHLGVGSMCEEDDERGHAHFLEHMAFAGTRHFGPGDVDRFFASLGTTLGHHHNAATTLESTRFTLSLPSHASAGLQRALTLLADFAFGITLPAAEIERQRAIILEEVRARLDPATRAQETLLAALVPGSRLAIRHPLGTRASVRSATRARLEDFYRRWYRPDLATLAVVGDVVVDDVLGMAERTFAPWPAGGATPRPPDPGVTASRELRAVALRSRDLTHVQASHRAVGPEGTPRTEAELAARWAARMAWWMVNRRLANRLAVGELPGEDARVSSSPLAPGWAVTRAVTVAPRGQTGALLEPLLVELHRARLHGFHAAEVVAARAALTAALREAAQGYPTRPAAAVLADLLDAAPRERPPLAPAQRVSLAKKLLPGVDEEATRVAFVTALPAEAGLLAAVVPARRGVPTPTLAGLLTAHRAAAATSPPVVLDLPATRLPISLPAPGSIAARTHHRAPTVTTLRFDNRAIVHLGEMRQRPGRVFLTLTLPGGRIREREGCLGITHAAMLVARHPAAAGVGPALFRDVLMARSVSLAATADEDCVTVSAVAGSDDLEEALKLLHVLLTGARLNRAAFGHWRDGLRRVEQQNEGNLEARLAQAAAALLSGGDPRFRLLTHADARAFSWRDAQRWLEEEICGAPLEAAIVGDVESNRAADLAARYLGSLPARPDRREELDALRSPAATPDRRTAVVHVPVHEDRAAILIGWRAAPWGERRTRHRLKVAEYILAQRLKAELREQRGLTYGVDCSFSPSKAYPALSLLAVACLLPPARLGEAAGAIHDTVAELAKRGPHEDELDAARTFLVRAARRAAGDPRQLARLLAETAYRGVDIAWLDRLDEDYLALDVAAVREVLRATCEERRMLTVAAACLPGGEDQIRSVSRRA